MILKLLYVYAANISYGIKEATAAW